MMRARRTYINLYNEECIIDIPPAEDQIEHHQSGSSSGSLNYQFITSASLQISAQAAIAVCGYALSGSSSHHPEVDFAAAATVVGFLCSWMAVAMGRKKPRLADFMAKISFTAAAAGVVVPMGLLVVPGNFKWLSVLLPVIPTIATFLFG